MDFLEAMNQKPERLVLLPANDDTSLMTPAQRERLEAHERLNRQREDAQFDRLESQRRRA